MKIQPAPARSFRGLTPEQRQQERFEKLVTAATREFGQRGFHNTTVRDICYAAQLTERYFYESFDNLPSLFNVVHERAIEQLKSEMLSAVMSAPRDALAMVEAALRVYLEFLSANPPRARMMLVDAVSGDRKVLGEASQRRVVFTALLRGFAQFIFPWLANPKGQLRLDVVCNGLVGATNYIAYDWITEGFATPLDNVLDSQLVFYRGIVLYAQSIAPTRESAVARPLAKPAAKKKPRR